MKFRDFIKYQETMTSTINVAGFPRIVEPMIQRTGPSDIEERKKKKKKPYMLPQVED